MKKVCLTLLILIFGAAFGFPQDEPAPKVEKRMKEVQEFKMKYLAQEMELSEPQKKKFFELYEEKMHSKHECYREVISLERKMKNSKDASDEDYQQATIALDKANAEWNEKEKYYNEKFAEFLTPKQLYKMKEAETNFRSKMEQMKHNRREHRRKPDEKN